MVVEAIEEYEEESRNSSMIRPAPAGSFGERRRAESISRRGIPCVGHASSKWITPKGTEPNSGRLWGKPAFRGSLDCTEYGIWN